MAIAFNCPTCGKAFSVADEFAGRSGLCKGCGHRFTVPTAQAATVAEEDEYGIATEGYGLVEEPARKTEPAVAMASENATVFSRAYNDDSELPRPKRAKSGKRKSSRRRLDDEPGFFEKHGKTLGALSIGVVCALAGVATFVEHGSYYVGMLMIVLGTILMLAGSLLGVYVAFTEDAMYGLLSIFFFPFYPAYYIVSRWDEMWPSFAIQTVGFLLGTFGGTLAFRQTGEVDEDARIERPSEPVAVLRPWLGGVPFGVPVSAGV